MSARLIIVAQGSTSAPRRGIFADDGLDEKGHAAAVAARDRLPKHDASFVSPASRSLETAELLNVDARVESALRDLDPGDWRGRSLDDIANSDAAGAAAFGTDPAFRGHGGESVLDLIERMRIWLEQRSPWSGVTLVVAPVMVARALTVAALDTAPQLFWRVDVTPLSRVTLATDGRRWTLRAFEPP